MVRVTFTFQPSLAVWISDTSPEANSGLERYRVSGGANSSERSEILADTTRAPGPPSETTRRRPSPAFQLPITVRPSLSPKNFTVMEVSVYSVRISTCPGESLRKTRSTSGQLMVASIPSG